MITVLLADDHDLVRVGLRTLLESDAFTVVAEAEDGPSAVAAAIRTRPDVALMDIQLPGIDGLEATRRIVAHDGVETRVIMLTTFERDEYVVDALRVGASGFLLKDTPPEQLLEAIRAVAGGGARLSPSVTRTVIRELVALGPRPVRPHPHLDQLTQREREIVGLVAEGMSNTEIAERLVISPDTARTHVSRAMIKLAARDRAQLAVFGYRSGLG